MLRKLICTVTLLLAGNVWAGANDVMVEKVWMRESVPDQTSATVQMNLYTVKPSRLMSVSSPLAASGEIQFVEMRGGKVQTRVMDSYKLEARNSVLFGSRGIYLALVGLKKPLEVGDRVPVTLVIEVAGKSQTLTVEAEVKKLDLSYGHYNNPTAKDHW